ncbi:bzip transcription factor [Niveomyces insectorum RCEF 264]|uniref:Bzip transcription factor n=1 Tax=Niveomyces insectorum RCEF 264 TaxID=1081102 RepID=A0A167UTN5_9HYPO|nr:bzip transcription factor [Niveomyces insectorum RCEF 264]
MESWDALVPSASPDVKLETSPVDSLLSDPSGVYSSLFSGSTVASSGAATPTETGITGSAFFSINDDNDSARKEAEADFRSMSPSVADGEDLMSTVGANDAASGATANREKKTSKKRRSWGQVLPEPKTNLPPRKRAKTEDEKEQRRVERVLRNRRAAQSSRERKRLEVEALERRNQELEILLSKARKENVMLYEQLTRVQGKSAVVPTGNPPVTLSQELFSSQDGHSSLMDGAKSGLGAFLPSQNPVTIDPVSLSPSLHPVPDTKDLELPEEPKQDGEEPQHNEKEQQQQHQQPSLPLPPSQPQQQKKQPAPQQSQSQSQPQPQLPAQQQSLPSRKLESSAAAGTGALATVSLGPSPDTTQRPAAALCDDLQCLSAEASQVWTVPQRPPPVAQALYYQMTLLLILSSTVLSACCRPMTQIALFLRAGISIPPTPAILNSIIWLTTTPSRRSWRRTLTSTTSSTRTDSTTSRPTATSSSATPASRRAGRPTTTLRFKMLRKILTCNPMLARPLMDATMRVLRSVCSEKSLGTVRAGEQVGPAAAEAEPWSVPGVAPDGSWRNPAALPSKEVLLTLLWALRVEEKRIAREAAATSCAAASPVAAKAGSLLACSRDKQSKGLTPVGLKRKRFSGQRDELPTRERRKRRLD